MRTKRENEATRYAVTIMLIETKPQKDVVAQAGVRFFAFTTKRFQRREAVGKKECRPTGNSRSFASFVP